MSFLGVKVSKSPFKMKKIRKKLDFVKVLCYNVVCEFESLKKYTF